jgi:hypothetical protein
MYHWFSKELCWKEKQDDTWVTSDPPRPEWAVQTDEIPPTQFIEVWATKSSLNDIKRIFFWKSIESILAQAEEISCWLEENEYEVLPERNLRSEELLNPEELEALEESGCIQKKCPSPLNKSTQSDQESYLPRQHIQVSEGGNMRFSSRH